MKGKLAHDQTSTSANAEIVPMMLYNSKCFFCNQEVKRNSHLNIPIVSPEILQACDKKTSPPNSRGVGLAMQKLGPGFSRMLTASREQADFESLFKQEEGRKKTTRNQKAAMSQRSKLMACNTTMHSSSAKRLAPIPDPNTSH